MLQEPIEVLYTLQKSIPQTSCPPRAKALLIVSKYRTELTLGFLASFWDLHDARYDDDLPVSIFARERRPAIPELKITIL
jgi:hypothetical protein